MRRLATTAAIFIAACGKSDVDSRLVTVDTLPGGIPRIMTRSPVDSGRWQLILDHVVQPAEGETGELMSPGDLALGDDGTLVVAETNPREIKVFDPSGAFLRRFGRDGEGPGEFRAAYVALRGDTLAIQDPRNSRASTFAVSTGSFIDSRMTTCCYYYPLGIDGAGRGVASAMMAPDSGAPPFQAFVRFAMTGSALDTVRIPERPVDPSLSQWIVREGGVMRFSRVVPLRPRHHHAVDRTGGFITGWSGEYLLRATRDGRDTTSLFGRPFANDPVTAEDKQAIVDEVIRGQLANDTDTPESVLRSAFDPAAIPDVRPAFEGILTDGAGRRWVRLSGADTTLVRIDLFAPDGRWLDQLTVPTAGWTRSAWEPVALSRDRAAVIGDDESGRPLIRVYRIERRE